MKRGLTYAEALVYLGIKRRTFDAKWRPHLVAMQQGACTIFDRQDLDALFDRFKREAADVDEPAAANDATAGDGAHNAPRNGRPVTEKGASRWANQHGASTPTATSGRSTSGGDRLDFASVASSLLKKRTAG